MSAPFGFAQRVAKYSDVQLAEVIASASDYTPEAVDVVMAEWSRRRLTAEMVAPIMARTETREEMLAEPNPTRPQTWKGIGMICYGREFAPKVGYITTQWFCLFFLPILPLQSFYVDRDGLDTSGIPTEIPMRIRQVLRTYSFLIAAAVFISAGGCLAAKFSDDGQDCWSLSTVFLSILAPIFSLQLLRRNARRQRPNSEC